MQAVSTALTSSPAHIDLDAITAELDDRGYYLIPVISPQEADDARSVLEPFLQAEMKDSHRKARTQRVGRIAVKHAVFLDLMCHPVVVSIWKRWLGEDVICSTWTANTIYPEHASIGWHADYPYWAMTPPWPTGRLTGQTIWMLDDFTEENGGTGVVPYSHHKVSPPDRSNEWRTMRRSSRARGAASSCCMARCGTRRGPTGPTGHVLRSSACTSDPVASRWRICAGNWQRLPVRQTS